MEYKGRYEIFDNKNLSTYPISTRKNKLSCKDFFDADKLAKEELIQPNKEIEFIADKVAEAYRKGRPVVVFTGAHPIKNGLSPLYIDLMKRGVITHIATNGAGTIHDFEIAIQGETSEDVRGALGNGQFGMAFETCRILNETYIEGNRRKIGYGESLGRLYNDHEFRDVVLDKAFKEVKDLSRYVVPRDGFKFEKYCVMGAAYKYKVPATIHVTLGTDINDQHENFDGEAKGGCSGRDFLIYTETIAKLTEAGVILNIGTAVTGPEVLLKAVSMVTNAGRKPDRIVCADFDIRPFVFDDEVRDESKYYYYLRDQKSVATRIPKVFGGEGYYIQGDHSNTVTTLFQYIRKKTG
jgi:translation initiation factor 1 (eIF-1/SUI1)